MNCIIIDDDKVTRILFEKYIEKTEFLTLKASFSNAIDAVKIINSEEKVDLIFLDIEMPEMSGLDFIKSFEMLPQVIIISAKEKHAIEAIEYNVVDYLLKPVSYARFFKAANKAYNRHKDQNNLPLSNDGIFIKTNTSALIRLKYDDILWIEALENYIVINTFEERYTIHFTMKSILNKLPTRRFARIHRSYIVNLNKVELIEDNAIIMKVKAGDKLIPIAKSYKNNLLDNINIISK
jgi:DNA-binding LytR/AlgR family response regulator